MDAMIGIGNGSRHDRGKGLSYIGDDEDIHIVFLTLLSRSFSDLVPFPSGVTIRSNLEGLDSHPSAISTARCPA